MAICVPGASILLDTVAPYFLSMAIGTLTTGNTAALSSSLWLAGVSAFSGVIINVIGYQVAARHESKVRNRLVHSTMLKLLAKDYAFFSNQKIGALTGRFIDFINGHIDLQALVTMRVANFALNIVLGLILIGNHTPMLALIVCGLVVLLLFQVRISRYLRRDLRIRRKELVGEVNGYAADVITNYTTVKTFATEENEVKSLDKLNDEYRDAYVKDYQWMSLEGSTRLLLMHAVQLFAVAIIASMLATKQIELGIAVFTIAYLQRLSTQLFTFGEILFGYDKIMLQAAPMTDILIAPPTINDSTHAKLSVQGGQINFDHVVYAYQDAKETDILHDFTLTIPAGQKVGLVGHSGAGKTTITKLLLRFDDIDSGTITIDGQDISKVTQSSLRQSIAYVPQEPMLFHRTLRENIAYGKDDATDKEIMEAAHRAHADGFITLLSQGLDTVVGERGIKLSGGQRQRIAIARALLKDAPILILDEATSALDSESEALIQQSFNTLMAGRTSIVVAHRLSTLRHMDRIIVMNDGKIVEDGSHTELLAQDGVYAKLWKRQSGGFIEE